MKNIYLFILFITLSSIAFCVDVPAQKSIEEIAVKLTTADGVTDRASLETFLNNKRGGNLNAEFPVNATQYPSSIVPDHCIFSGYFMPLADGMHIASFSDDGVTIKTKEVSKMIEGVEMPSDPNINWEVKVPMYGQGIPLPDLSKSLQDVGNGWVKNTKYQVEVEYSNISHPDYTDIDGATLFFYGSDVSFTKMPVINSLSFLINKSNVYNYLPNYDTVASVTIGVTEGDSISDVGCKQWVVTISPPADKPTLTPTFIYFTYVPGKTTYTSDDIFFPLSSDAGTYIYTASITEGSTLFSMSDSITVNGVNVTASTTDNLLLIGETFSYTMSIPNPTSIVINNNGDTYTNQSAKVTIIGDLYEYDANGDLKLKQVGAFYYGIDSQDVSALLNNTGSSYNELGTSLNRDFILKLSNPGVYKFHSQVSINPSTDGIPLVFSSNASQDIKIVKFNQLPDEVYSFIVDTPITNNITFYPPLSDSELNQFEFVSEEVSEDTTVQDKILDLYNSIFEWFENGCPISNDISVQNKSTVVVKSTAKKNGKGKIITRKGNTSSTVLQWTNGWNYLSCKISGSYYQDYSYMRIYIGNVITESRNGVNPCIKQIVGVETTEKSTSYVGENSGEIGNKNKWIIRASYSGYNFGDIRGDKYRIIISSDTTDIDNYYTEKIFGLKNGDPNTERELDLPKIPVTLPSTIFSYNARLQEKINGNWVTISKLDENGPYIPAEKEKSYDTFETKVVREIYRQSLGSRFIKKIRIYDNGTQIQTLHNSNDSNETLYHLPLTIGKQNVSTYTVSTKYSVDKGFSEGVQLDILALKKLGINLEASANQTWSYYNECKTDEVFSTSQSLTFELPQNPPGQILKDRELYQVKLYIYNKKWCDEVMVYKHDYFGNQTSKILSFYRYETTLYPYKSLFNDKSKLYSILDVFPDYNDSNSPNWGDK